MSGSSSPFKKIKKSYKKSEKKLKIFQKKIINSVDKVFIAGYITIHRRNSKSEATQFFDSTGKERNRTSKVLEEKRAIENRRFLF